MFVAIAVTVLLAACGEAAGQSWIFAPGHFTHDPQSGARVAQYQRVAPVEELPDPRVVTSGYRRIRTQLRGTDGSVDTTYQVQNYGNGRGGLDAEWERFNEVWQQSTLSGGYYQQQGGYGYGGYGPGYGYGGYGGGAFVPQAPGYHGPWAPGY